jgi:hypothetical protein
MNEYIQTLYDLLDLLVNIALFTTIFVVVGVVASHFFLVTTQYFLLSGLILGCLSYLKG